MEVRFHSFSSSISVGSEQSTLRSPFFISVPELTKTVTRVEPRNILTAKSYETFRSACSPYSILFKGCNP